MICKLLKYMFGHNQDLKIIQELIDLNKLSLKIIDRLLTPPIDHRKNLFTFQFLNYKSSAMSNAILSVPTGTPVTGFNSPVDVKDNVLPDSAYKVGSCVYAVIAGPSGNPPGFTVAPGAKEEAFVVTETTPGTASDGIITFDAQDVNGTPLPQSQGTLSFTATPALAVGSAFNFDQTTH